MTIATVILRAAFTVASVATMAASFVGVFFAVAAVAIVAQALTDFLEVHLIDQGIGQFDLSS